MSERRNVLISSAGRRGELVEIFQKSLRDLDPEASVYTADVSSLSAAGLLGDGHHLVPRLDSPQYVDHLLELCASLDVGHIIPTIDTELSVYAAARETFRDAGTVVWVSGSGSITVARDKKLTNEFLRAHRLPHVLQWSLDEARQQDLPYPVVAKPAAGSSSVGLAYLSSPADLDRLDADLDYVIEATASGVEHTVDVLVDTDGAARLAVPRRRLEVRAGEVSKGITIEDEDLARVARDVAEALPDAFGVLNVQVFRDALTGDMAVIEINARFGGGFPLTYRAGGDAPRWLLERLRGVEPTTSLTWEPGLVMLRFDRAVFAPASQVGLTP